MKERKIPPRLIVKEGVLTPELQAMARVKYDRFRQVIDTSIAPFHTDFGVLDNGSKFTIVSNHGVDTMTVTPGVIMRKGAGTIVVDADYLVVTYGFSEAAGRDLDTRTRLVTPGAMSYFVGWARGFEYQVDIEGEPVDVVRWSGDNTGTGAESVLIDLQAIKTAFGASTIRVQARALWFGSRLTGNCDFKVEAYKGGTMSLASFIFSNTGGEKVAEVTKTQNVPTETRSSAYDGDLVADVTFNPATNELTLA